jgi:tRNA (Thr-GGU) A37 N-methylase
MALRAKIKRPKGTFDGNDRFNHHHEPCAMKFSLPLADDDALSFAPIGVILTPWNTRYDAPRQPRTGGEGKTFVRCEAGDAIIRLKPRRNYEQALQDLERIRPLVGAFRFSPQSRGKWRISLEAQGSPNKKMKRL